MRMASQVLADISLRVIANHAMLSVMTTDAIIPMGAAEAEKLLDVSRDTLIRMATDGRIEKAVKLGGDNGQWVFDRDEINALASAKTAAATA